MLSVSSIKLLDIAAPAILTNSTLFANFKATGSNSNNAYLQLHVDKKLKFHDLKIIALMADRCLIKSRIIINLKIN